MAQANKAQVATNICICSGARGDFFCIECEQHFCQTCRISHKKAKVSNSHHLVEALETKSKDCEICLTKYGGQFFCLDCDQYFCSNCKTSHLRANVSKNHTFTDSSELKKTHTQRSGRPFVKSWKKKKHVNENNKYNKRNEQGDGGNFEPPPEWDEHTGSENVKLVTLLNTSPEYKLVEQKFLTSIFSGRPEWVNQFNKQSFKVTKIERLQNLSLYHMYAAKKALMDKQNPTGTNNEKELWHGAHDLAVVSINFYGFNRSYCHVNSKDEYWGEGVYFAADASYSARGWLSKPSVSGEHNMYMCKVLTGVSCPGQRGMRVLPVRKDGTNMNYDSATDTNYNPTVEYVIFHDTQAYPQYCIKFKY